MEPPSAPQHGSLAAPVPAGPVENKPACRRSPAELQKRILHRQRQGVESSVETMNRGVRLLFEGRDSRAVGLFKEALDTIERCIRQTPRSSCAPSRSGFPSRAPQAARAGRASGPLAVAGLASRTTTERNPVAVGNIDQSTSPGTSPACNTSHEATDSFSESAATKLSEEEDTSLRNQDSHDDSDGTGKKLLFERFHITVPICKSNQNDHPSTQQPPSSSSFAVYNNALMLSMDEIKVAQNFHRIERKVEYECGSCIDSDNGNDTTDAMCREAFDAAIESEFMHLVLPTIHACAAYNMALLFDAQSRCLPVSSTGQQTSQGSLSARERESDRRQRLYFARQAYTLYGTAARAVGRKQWGTFGTALLVRIAAINNRTALLTDQHVGPVSGHLMQRAIDIAANSLHAMIRYGTRHFQMETTRFDTTSVVHTVNVAFSSGSRPTGLHIIWWNISLWKMMCANVETWIYQKFAAAA